MNEIGDIELRWHDLRAELPPGDRPVILFPQISDCGHLFDVERSYVVSNPEYVRLRALEQGYTHWFPVPIHPQEAAIRAKIEELYAHENDNEVQFAKGFQRAVENMTNFIKEIVPDRPNVILAIEDRFGQRGPIGHIYGMLSHYSGPPSVARMFISTPLP